MRITSVREKGFFSFVQGLVTRPASFFLRGRGPLPSRFYGLATERAGVSQPDHLRVKPRIELAF